jgi:hypothetical protein
LSDKSDQLQEHLFEGGSEGVNELFCFCIYEQLRRSMTESTIKKGWKKETEQYLGEDQIKKFKDVLFKSDQKNLMSDPLSKSIDGFFKSYEDENGFLDFDSFLKFMGDVQKEVEKNLNEE